MKTKNLKLDITWILKCILFIKTELLDFRSYWDGALLNLSIFLQFSFAFNCDSQIYCFKNKANSDYFWKIGRLDIWNV